jgi:hypothetical protein
MEIKETKLILTPKGFNSWELAEDFIQNLDNETIKVPKSFKTNLASVPRLFWSIIPPFGKYSQASVIHDYLYFSKIYSKKESDKIFYKFMLQYGTYKWKAIVMYLAVKLFGSKAWQK